MADRKCGCGPGEDCIECAPIDELVETFMAATLAKIRAGEVRHGC